MSASNVSGRGILDWITSLEQGIKAARRNGTPGRSRRDGPTAGGTFGTALDYFSSTTALTVNAWSHLALTWDGTIMRLYVNGTQVATRSRTGTLQGTSAGAGTVRIGNNVPYGERFIGQIDEVRIYNRALSAAEVTTDMNAPVP
jgi:Concanavalin A-like lectin/glucanases superfamily